MSNHPTRKYYDLVWLREEYVEKGRTAKDIATECGVETDTVSQYASENGIKKYPDKKADYKQEGWLRARFIEDEMSMGQVARESEHDISTAAARYWIQKYDLHILEWKQSPSPAVESLERNERNRVDGNNPSRVMGKKSKEPVRECQYCGEEIKSRGLFAHTMNSVGDGHGDYREVPDNFSHSKSSVVGSQEIMTKRETVTSSESGNEVVYCLICNKPQKGMRGYHIHITKQAGQNGHPENSSSITPDMFEAVPADEDYNPLYEPNFDELKTDKSTFTKEPQEGMFIPLPALVELHDIIIEGGRDDALDELNAIVQRYS
jgi:hypothetical protein